METNKYRIDFGDDGEVSVLNIEKPPTIIDEIPGEVIAQGENKFNFLSESSVYFEQFDSVFDKCVHKIAQMSLKHDDTDTMYSIMGELLKEKSKLVTNLSTNKENTANDTATEYVIGKVKSVASRYLREKHMKQQTMYVAPIEKSIGMKWKRKKDINSDLPDYKIVSTTFQYVPIEKTLQSLFLQDDFAKTYFEHNENHKCIPGTLKSFCCGTTYQNFQIYRGKNVVEIILSVDDFEVCAALKSKTKKHKQCGVYFQVNNFPDEFKSQLNQIFLVALCKTEDLKYTDECFDSIGDLIRNELKNLETVGFTITHNDKHVQMKAALAIISSDNLGGNGVFGFMECFRSHQYCRICTCDRGECQKNIQENKEKLRTKEMYADYFDNLPKNQEVDTVLTNGIKKYCIFNDLENFNTTDNVSVDLMHDAFEGVVPMFLNLFFANCIENKILKKIKVIELVRDFNYGAVSRRNIPSALRIGKPNLGQSASQNRCLILNTPFIFFEYRNKLKEVWPVLEDLLQCLQIVCSTEIREADIVRLEGKIKSHLEGVIKVFKTYLKPKQHIFTHYATVLRKLGPVIYFWMMRFESKHKFFTDIGNATYNFVNISKTLAERHQQHIFVNPFSLNIVENSRISKQFLQDEKFGICASAVIDLFGSVSEEMESIRFFEYNNYRYEEGTLIIEDFNVFEIFIILAFGGKNYLVCHRYDFVKFDKIFNSIQIKKNNGNLVIKNYMELKNKKNYEKIVLKNDTIHIIADTLNVFNNFN